MSAARLATIRALIEEGRFEMARDACARLLRAQPRNADAAALMAFIHLRTGDLVRAEHVARHAVALAPRDARAHLNLARILGEAGRDDEALDAGARAGALAPADPESYRVRALILAGRRRYLEAEAVCREGLGAARADDRDLLATRALALLNVGLPDEGFAILDDLCRRAPDDEYAAECRAQVASYTPALDPRRVFEAHRAFGSLLEARAGGPLATGARHSGDRLRIALLTPDLRWHSVAFFVLPLLRRLDRRRCEVWVYYTNAARDALTDRCRALCDRWTDCPGQGGQTLAHRIAGDAPDVLVELSGLTHGHSLAAVAWRPAPVVVTYLGYASTTGLTRVDARFVDTRTDPPGSLASEPLVRLDPCFLCYEPPEEPAVPPRPSGAGVVFGSFNAAPKINREVVRLWSRVLRETPGSRLVLKTMNFSDPRLRAEFAGRFAALGVEPERLHIRPPDDDPRMHLAHYAGIDVALDPFPYCGTTTTLEALWMGVPVITLEGTMHAGRVGASILACAGLPDLVASTPAEYVRLAADLARDEPRRATLRATLRHRLRCSPLMDADAFADRFLRAVELLAAGERA
jgi:protein O-GlcNAc transferase